jgi:isochorismate synthase
MRRTWPPGRAETLRPAYDLFAAYEPDAVFFGRGGLGVVGSAEAFRFTFPLERRRGAPDTRELIERTFAEHEATDGPPPVMFVSADFDVRRDASAIVPREIVRRDRTGETWRISTHDDGPDGRTPRRAEHVAPHEAFNGMQLTPNPHPETYRRAVGEAVRRIERSELRKVVLARTVRVTAGRRLDAGQLLRRLAAVDPDAFAFAFPFPGRRPKILVGASPELLVERAGLEVRSSPLAGSAPRSGDPDEDRSSAERLLASEKDREEHAVVVEDVEERLGPFCSDLAHDPEPVLLATANVWHLRTRFLGTLREPATDALTLALALHPTAAVGGSPRDRALELIRELEPFPRGGYAGPIGWVDAAGDGVFAIALRCAELRRDTATLFAGAGIVAGSSPELELDETERKLRAFLDSLRWG